MRTPNIAGERHTSPWKEGAASCKVCVDESHISEAKPPLEHHSPQHMVLGFELYRCFPLAKALKTPII